MLANEVVTSMHQDSQNIAINRWQRCIKNVLDLHMEPVICNSVTYHI